MIQFSGFDPLKFLSIANLKDEDKHAISKNLLNKISQYLLIRIVEILPIEDAKSISDQNELFAIAQNKIPDLNEKVKLFLEDFKKEFYKNINV